LEWDITVLTANEAYYPPNSPVDRELAKKIPATVKVESTKIFSGVSKLFEVKSRLTAKDRKLNSPAQNARKNASQAGAPTRQDDPEDKAPRSFFQRTKDFISDLTTIPDKDVNWLPYALRTALKLHWREQFDLVYSTAPPFTGHLVAYLFKKFTGLPWVADFRDPWARAPWKAELMDGTLRGRAAEVLEAKFVRAADRVVLNTDWAAREFSQFYGAEMARKFTVIPNGFDPEDFAEVHFPGQKNGKLIMTHTGSLYRRRDPQHFFNALGQLVATGQIAPKEIEVRFVGGIAAELYRSFQYGEALQQVLKVMPPVSHREALACQAESDVLLILQPGTSVSVPGKIFEYIAMRKKILALTPAGATADVVRNHQLGLVADPEDMAGIQRALMELMAEFRNGGVSSPSADGAFHKYDGVVLTRQLHEEFLRCVSSRP
jgi:glycosyltransferase involved in cell wall biosynthesis